MQVHVHDIVCGHSQQSIIIVMAALKSNKGWLVTSTGKELINSQMYHLISPAHFFFMSKRFASAIEAA